MLLLTPILKAFLKPLEHEVADRGRCTVVVVEARAGADEGDGGSVVGLQQRGRRRDEGEVEVDEVLGVEVRERLLVEVDPRARSACITHMRQEISRTYWSF